MGQAGRYSQNRYEEEIAMSFQVPTQLDLFDEDRNVTYLWESAPRERREKILADLEKERKEARWREQEDQWHRYVLKLAA